MAKFKIYMKYLDQLSGVASTIEDIIRANSDIGFAVYEKNADLIIDLGYSYPTGKNTLHCMLYDHNPIIKNVSDSIYNAGKKRNILVDYGKIDKRIAAPGMPTVFVKLGRANYEINENSWASAIAEGIISGVIGDTDISDPIKYSKPSIQKPSYERNFAQEPTRNSDIFLGR